MNDSEDRNDRDIDFNEGVWRHVIGTEDVLIGGVLYDGTQWESDGEGGVQRRLYGPARIQREDLESELANRLSELRQQELEDNAERDCAVEAGAE